MKKLTSLIASLVLAMFLCAPAFAQSAGAQLPAGYYWGNPNASGQRAIPASQSAMLDRALGSTRGAIIERGASGWALIGPSSTAGLPFINGGTGVDPSYAVLGIVGGGTNCSVASGTCLDNITGFASNGYLRRTGAGTYSFDDPVPLSHGGTGATAQAGAANAVLPTPTRAGDVLYWNGSAWVTLAGNNSGTQFLQENSSGLPSWVTVSGTGTVTNIATGAGLVGGPITTTGTISLQQNIPGGRLTLTSGVPITTTDVTGATVVYYAPITGEYVPIYNGTSQQLYQFTSSTTDTVGLSVTLGTNWASGSAYDWFIALNGGSPVLCSGPAWSSAAAGSSSRGTGAGTTQLALFDGLYTNAVSITCRTSNTTTITVPANEGTYVGSSLMTGAGATEDSAAKRYLYNLYNQSQRKLKSPTETTNTWTYATVAWRQANANTANQFSIFVGQPGGLVNINVAGAGDSSPINFVAVGIGIDSTTTDSADMHQYTVSGNKEPMSASMGYYPTIGLHNIVWLEAVGLSGGTNDFYGQQVNSGVISQQSGIFGRMLD